MVGAVQAVAMQQFVAGSIQVGPEWRAAVRRRKWFEKLEVQLQRPGRRAVTRFGY